MKYYLLTSIFLLLGADMYGQRTSVSGKVMAAGLPLAYASVQLDSTSNGAITDATGHFEIHQIAPGNYTVTASSVGYVSSSQSVTIYGNTSVSLNFDLRESTSFLSEVVVTGVSKATLIRENPVAIVSISPKQLEETSAPNIIDAIIQNTPGMNAVKTGPNISKPFIRGLGYNRVLTLYNGVRQEDQQWGDEHGLEIDGYNIHRVEVIKGPASLMYGSGALAGVIQFFPHIPDAGDGRLHGKYTGEYQTNNNLIGNGVQLESSSDHWISTLTGSYRMAKNYRNSIDGRVYLTNFNEKNLATLVGYRNEKGYTHFQFTLYDNRQGIPDGSRDSLTRKFTRQIYEGTADTIKNRPIVSEQVLNKYKIPALSQHIQHYRIYLHKVRELGTGDINVQLALQQNVRREYNHPTNPDQAGMYVRLNTLNYGVQYNAPAPDKLALTLGSNGMLQTNKSLDATDFPIPDFQLADQGGYLYGIWKSGAWTMSGGIRYDMRRVKWDDFFVKTNAETGFDEHVTGADTTGATLQYSAFSKWFTGLSYSLGATLRLFKHLSLKANIGRAYRAPNITEMASNGLDPGAHIIYLGNRSFQPEFSLQEDLGISSDFSDFSFTASIFNTHIQHYIYLSLDVDDNDQPIVDNQGNKTYQYQQSKAQLYGAEAQLSFHPENLKGFQWDNSLSIVYGFNRNPAYRGTGTNGAYLPFIPPARWNSGIFRTFQFTAKRQIGFTPKLEIEVIATQNRYLGLYDTETRTPGYTLMHIGMVFSLPTNSGHAWQLLIHANNLLNKAYQSNMSRLKYFEYYSQSSNGHTGIYNMGRNLGIKLTTTF